MLLGRRSDPRMRAVRPGGLVGGGRPIRRGWHGGTPSSAGARPQRRRSSRDQRIGPGSGTRQTEPGGTAREGAQDGSSRAGRWGKGAKRVSVERRSVLENGRARVQFTGQSDGMSRMVGTRKGSSWKKRRPRGNWDEDRGKFIGGLAPDSGPFVHLTCSLIPKISALVS